MKVLLVLALALGLNLAKAAYCGGDGFPQDAKSRKDNCETLLEGGVTSSSQEQEADSGSGSGSGAEGSGLLPYNDYCLLLKYFFNISASITDETVRNAWVQMINEIQETIIYDSSLSGELKLVAIYSRLVVFFGEFSEVTSLVENTFVTEWNGFVFDLKGLTVLIQESSTQTILELDASGSCTLFDSLLNGTSSNAELHTKVETLVSELKTILENSSLSYSSKLVQIFEKIQIFFEVNAKDQLTLEEINIEGYGSFASFFQVVASYWRVSHYDLAVSGSSASDVALIQVLTAAYQNSTAFSVSERAQIKQLVNSLTNAFNQDASVSGRISKFFSIFYQFLILNEWSVSKIFTIEITSTYGTIEDFINAFALQQDCGCIDFSAGTVQTSTSASAADCADAEEIVAFSSNTSDLLWSIDQAEVSWNATVKSRFEPYHKRIYVVSSNGTASNEEKFENIKNVLNRWTTNQAYLNIVYSVKVTLHHGSSSASAWGTVHDFCGCS